MPVSSRLGYLQKCKANKSQGKHNFAVRSSSPFSQLYETKTFPKKMREREGEGEGEEKQLNNTISYAKAKQQTKHFSQAQSASLPLPPPRELTLKTRASHILISLRVFFRGFLSFAPTHRRLRSSRFCLPFDCWEYFLYQSGFCLPPPPAKAA